MSVKEKILESIQDLPDDATAEAIRDKVELVLGVYEAISSVDAGRGVPKEDVKPLVRKWATQLGQ